MDSLRHIELLGCAGVSNEGIKSLARLPDLEKLELSGMQRVTREALTAFPGSIEVQLTT
jgi:hypothetical protein